LHIHTPHLFQVELEKDGWELVDMLWCQGAQNIGLSNRKLKSVRSAPYNHNGVHALTPVTDRQTEKHHGNSVTSCSMNASHAKNTNTNNTNEPKSQCMRYWLGIVFAVHVVL